MKSTLYTGGNFLGFDFGKSISIPKIFAIPFWILYGFGKLFCIIGQALFDAIRRSVRKF